MTESRPLPIMFLFLLIPIKSSRWLPGMAASDLHLAPVRGSRRSYELCNEPSGCLAASWCLDRPDSQGRKTCRFAVVQPTKFIMARSGVGRRRTPALTQSGHGGADFAATHNNFFRLVSSPSSTVLVSCGGMQQGTTNRHPLARPL